MRYVILAKGGHTNFIRQLTIIGKERLLDRTIRLLRENGVKDIVVTGEYNDIDAKVINPTNNTYDYKNDKGYWLDAFNGFLDRETCFIWGDVYFSEYAIKTIVESETKSTLFFCSYQNKSKEYIKKWDEPFAYKVVDVDIFRKHREICKQAYDKGITNRHPIVWELYRSINGIDINKHELKDNVKIINDITCDIDTLEDVYRLRLIVGGNMVRVKCKNVDFSYSKFSEIKELVRGNAFVSEEGHIYPGDTFLVTDEEAKYLTETAQWVKDNGPLVDIIEVIPDKEEKIEKKSQKVEEKPKKRGKKSAK